MRSATLVFGEGIGQWNTDFSVFKDFKIRERITLQFRSEFFNIMNHANFALGSDTNGKLSLDSASLASIPIGTEFPMQTANCGFIAYFRIAASLKRRARA